jgi:hypothetical protein
MACPTPGALMTTRFEQRLGLFRGATVNMTQMCGIAPFATIPG